MDKKIKHITVASYTHPELYPPVLSAVDELAQYSEEIDIISRNMLFSKWKYPSNTSMTYVNGKNYTGFGIEKISLRKKMYHFLKFIFKLKNIVKTKQSELVIVHDVIPLFAAYLIRNALAKQNIILWYHNHDVTDIKKSGKYSIMGIAARFEKKAFKYIDIFTLPSKERIKYFPIELLNSQPIILPNYPLQRFYEKNKKIKTDLENQTLKLVFQGSIGHGHGLEDIIEFLHTKINNKRLELHLVGKIRDSYLKKIEDLVSKNGVQHLFYYHGMKSFAELPEFLNKFDIGLAIHEPYNVTYATGGTASNKIYEYAACGLPVVLFDNSHYRSYLEKHKWTFFTDLSKASLNATINSIDKLYHSSSKSATADFEKYYNFETVFKETMLPILNSKLNN